MDSARKTINKPSLYLKGATMIQTITLWTGFVSIILAVYAVYSVKRCTQTLSILEEGLKNQVQGVAEGLREHVDIELEPLITKVNRAFGMKGEASGRAKRIEKAEGMIIQDVLNTQDPVLMGLLEMVSPATKEYLEENPGLIVELIPRLQALQSVEGFSILDLLKPPPPGGAPRSGKHPFGNREE